MTMHAKAGAYAKRPAFECRGCSYDDQRHAHAAAGKAFWFAEQTNVGVWHAQGGVDGVMGLTQSSTLGW